MLIRLPLLFATFIVALRLVKAGGIGRAITPLTEVSLTTMFLGCNKTRRIGVIVAKNLEKGSVKMPLFAEKN